ncbi:MAG: hypothetical protein HKP28_05045, partial [Winogradskyella sp.]|nr:hypothetical protein [Winogradskyella sp.]
MKTRITLLLMCFVITSAHTQIEKSNKKLVAMSNTYQKAYKLGSVYYEVGTDKPFTGILYGKYDNGNYMTMQEYEDGIGNGKWADFDPYGRKMCEGTYKNNRV